MLIDRLEIGFLGSEARNVDCPVTAFNISWRKSRHPDRSGCARIIFSEGDHFRLVYLIDDGDESNLTVEIPLGEVMQLDTSILEKSLSRIAKRWNVTAEDLIDRIRERRPKGW